jgi:hypothetical protein
MDDQKERTNRKPKWNVEKSYNIMIIILNISGMNTPSKNRDCRWNWKALQDKLIEIT